MNEYQEFLESKRIVDVPTGIGELPTINPMLFDWQADIVRWSLKRGRAAIFADCGLGKTPMQLEWAKHVERHTDRPVLLLAPLAVAAQTVRESVKFGVDVEQVRGGEAVGDRGIYITNYEMLEHFDASAFGGVVLDESSILKSYAGHYRNLIIESFAGTPFRLACTATPAPNDHMELANHAEFMGVMERQEMLATFFTHDSSETQKWRLKGHAQDEFWKWMASWAVSISKPSDIGHEDGRFELPPLQMHEHVVEVDHTEATPDGFLFRPQAVSLGDLRQEQRLTVDVRADEVAELVNASDEPWIVWCNRNDESAALCERIDGAVEITGSHDSETKADRMLAFSDGDIRVLVTKPSIAGFGMNWQHCRKVAFVGLSHSYEQFYQAVRRCWRFGQDQPVDCHVVVAETEGAVLESIRRKEKQAREMNARMTNAMSEISTENMQGMTRDEDAYVTDEAGGEDWTLYLGDCVEMAGRIEDESVGCSIFSPPFSSLYTYSNSSRDMGNSGDDGEFFEHFGFLIDELMRVTMPGRNCLVHCSNLTTTKSFDGEIGIRDFRGDIIRAFRKRGWTYHSEICIWKDPVTSMQRTKAHGLLYKTLRSDSARSRQGLADYLLVFRKQGDNPLPIEHTPEDFPLDDWQKWASPVWDHIDQTDVLNNYRHARSEKDERHICPLQLGLIRDALRLWSAPDDLVFSPFAGIGSEGYVALDMGRRFVGSELKPSYWRQAVQNLEEITTPDPQVSWLDTTFDDADGDLDEVDGEAWGDAESTDTGTQGAAE